MYFSTILLPPCLKTYNFFLIALAYQTFDLGLHLLFTHNVKTTFFPQDNHILKKAFLNTQNRETFKSCSCCSPVHFSVKLIIYCIRISKKYIVLQLVRRFTNITSSKHREIFPWSQTIVPCKLWA